MKKKLLIINKTQFGYHTDYYKYCEYLKQEYCITFFCFDTGFEKLVLDNVNVKYMPWKGPRFIRGVLFIILAIFNIIKHKGVVFIHYFENCQLLTKLFPKKKMILDIRTLSIHPNKYVREKQDIKLLASCKSFDYVTVISKGIQEKLKFNKNKTAILPLGADSFSERDRDFASLNLLYVGTLNGRDIAETIKGVSLFKQNNPNVPISYEIIGDGQDLNMLKKLIFELGLDTIVKMYGRIPHFQLTPYFDKSNVGVAYVPMTDFYNHQPATKTYEYILSGMPCIATNTFENRKVITHKNGVLCNDNAESFANAITLLNEQIPFYESEKIRETLIDYSWGSIIKNKLQPIFQQFQ